MSHFAADVHRRTSLRLSQVIPDFVENDHPQFVEFIRAYFEFLEQVDNLPLTPTFVQQEGVISVQAESPTIVGFETQFSSDLAPEQRLRVGSDTFVIRTIANNTTLLVYDSPSRTYFANTYLAEINKSSRQASGALRQLLTYHDFTETLDGFIPYFRDTYLRDVPQGLVATETLIPKVLDFYQARGSEEAFRFLFRALYNQEIELTYPRDSVFTTSDCVYEQPITIKLASDTITGNAALLETRTILGLTSNARATISRVVQSYEGAAPITSLFVDEIVQNTVLGNLLVDSDDPYDDGGQILITAFGEPPAGLSTVVYDFGLALESTSGGSFVPGELVSTVPINDPIAITGRIVGSVVGFTIIDGGENYQLGDLVFPPPGFNGGYGAVGRISAFVNINITGIDIISGGDGYYSGLALEVDNSGTGGSGLSGIVSEVSSGNLLLHEDAGSTNAIADGDRIIFRTYIDPLIPIVSADFIAAREKVDYFELGLSLSDVLGVQLSENDWSGGNTASALYGTNLDTIISQITAQLSVFPWYVNGIRTEIGRVEALTIFSLGSNYLFGTPTVRVANPINPTEDMAGTLPVGPPAYIFTSANLVALKAEGQIGAIDVVSGGAAYGPSTNTFAVNSSTSIVAGTGNGAILGLVLGAISVGQGRFLNTRSMPSGDQYLQSLDKYQPFAYELTVEQDQTVYGDVVKQLVHPAGGLLLVRQTVTTPIDLLVNMDDVEIEVGTITP